MLQTLTIRNLALLEEVSLDFEAGFTAVTGETGAGKSILLGALSLLAGERVEKTVIRQGADSCEVEATLWFAEPGRIDSILAELDLPACEDGVLLLKRSIARTRAPKLSVNGSMTTLGALQRLGEAWIDFHGPSEPRRLLKAGCQLELLDLFAQAGKLLTAFQGAYAEWRNLQRERVELSSQTQLSPEQIEFNRNQLAKLDALDLSEEAIEKLERDFKRISGAQELAGLAEGLESGLAGDDGISNQLAGLLRAAGELAELDDAGPALQERLQAVAIEVADLAAEFAALAGQFSFEPEEVELVQRRMNDWLDARRRHGRNLAAVISAREEMRARLDAQGDLKGALTKLDQRIGKAHESAGKAAAKLRAVRQQAATKLAKVAAKSIEQLGFKQADFRIGLRPLDELGPQGDCEVEFMFSPNVGEAPLPLHRIASSGELARVMLALKTVLADLDAVPVLVFDEVDANVGGEIGAIVGQQMAAIGSSHQVLCVTHLPQVAAQAASHLVVEKDQSRDRARVEIRPIHDDETVRVDELARMLGSRTAVTARTHAQELLAGRAVKSTK